MWNGTEFEELSIPAPAVNVPYYYIDPTDNNYAYLVVCDENGQNEKSIRLPLNEGLAQIQLVDENTMDLTVNYAISMEGTNFAEWNGPKAKPAKGEYIVTQGTDSILVQVTPANYDLAALELKVLDSNNNEVPLKLGEAVPYKGLMTRATSGTGLNMIPVTYTEISDELTEKYKADGTKKAVVSLYANDKVRSPYNGGLKFSLNDCTNATDVNTIDLIKFISNTFNFNTTPVDVELGKDYTFEVAEGKEFLYDAYITMYDGSEKTSLNATDKANIEAAKADQIRYGIKCDGLTISAESAVNDVLMSLHYIDVRGVVRHKKVTVNFGEAPVEEVIDNVKFDNIAHTAATKADNQYIVIDLAKYFDTMTADERLVWNADVDAIGLTDLFTLVKPKDATGSKDVTHVYTNTASGRTETEYLDMITSVTAVKSDGKTAATKASEIAKLKVKFDNNYDANATLTLGQYTTIIGVNYKKDSESAPSIKSTLEVPFTIADPTEADIAAQFTFNNQYYANGVLTIVSDNITDIIDLDDYITATGIDYTGITITGNDKPAIQTDKSEPKPSKAGEWTVSGIKFTVLGKEYDAPSFKLKVAVAQPYSVDFTKASPVVTSGMEAESTTIEYYIPKGTNEDKNHTNYYYIKNVTGNAQEYGSDVRSGSISVVTGNGNPTDLINVTISGGAIIITPQSKKVTVDTTVKVKATFTMIDGKIVDYEFNVTVKAYPM